MNLPTISDALIGLPAEGRLKSVLFEWVALSFLAVIVAGGINFIDWLKDQYLCFPDPRYWFNSFFVVTARTEPAGLWLFLGFCLLATFLFWKKPRLVAVSRKSKNFSPGSIIILLAVGCCLFSWLGHWLVIHQHPLACDEFMPDFQGQIFLSGELQAEIPENLRPAAHALAPLQTLRDKNDTLWNQGYLPVYAALRVPFLALHLQTLLNPLLGGLSVFGIARVIRLIWPGKPWLAVAGAAMIALSPQILITGMTTYAMPAHLALNTLWLWLFLQPAKKRFWLAPFVGVLAIGLHSPFVHALFVLPFLIRLLIDRRWKVALIFGLIYLAGNGGCWYWWHSFAPANVGPQSSLFSWHAQRFVFIQSLNVLNLLSWNALPWALLALMGLKNYPRLPVPVRDAFWSGVITFIFYSLIAFDQSYGWGNRYCYGVLGCGVLLAVAGLEKWTDECTGKRPAEFLVLGLILTLCVSVPLRCWQVERFIRPFALAEQSFQKMDADLVVMDSRLAWNSGDLLRNSPFLNNRPLIANQRHLTTENLEILRKQFPRIHYVTREEMTGYGLSTVAWTGKTSLSP